MRLRQRQRIRDAARQERGRCFLVHAFLTHWEADRVNRLALDAGVSVEVVVGELARRGLDGFLDTVDGKGKGHVGGKRAA